MEKKYCTHCRRLSIEGQVCDGCGKTDFQAIVISVQSSKQFKRNPSNENFSE